MLLTVTQTSTLAVYADGISITHGLPRQHIWSFAAGRDEITAVELDSTCPCSLNGTNTVPTFIGNNYFCDTGTITNNSQELSILTIPCGMDKPADPQATAAPSTHHHGSLYDCQMPQLITLKSELVLITPRPLWMCYLNF